MVPRAALIFRAPWAALTFRADSTTRLLKLNGYQNAERFKWHADDFDELRAFLSETQITKLQHILKSTMTGYLHVNSLRGRIRWGQLKEHSERLVFRPNAIQRNRCANLRASMDRAAPELGCTPLLKRCLPIFDWVNLVIFS